MRKHLIWTCAIATAIAVGVSAAALAAAEKPTVIRAGNLVLTLNGGVSPKAFSKTKLSPVSLHVSGGIATANGSHPPALREVILDTGRTGVVNTKGVPVCTPGKIQATDTRHAEAACKGAIVGKGKATVQVAFPEQRPFNATGPLVVFNGGTRGGMTTLYVHAYVSVPTPTAIVTTVKISKEHKGLFNLRSVSSIPLIAGGSGSVTSFELTINRKGYLLAKCSDGRFFANAAARFRDGSEVSGDLVRPCKGIG
jgi:hypothetical protein